MARDQLAPAWRELNSVSSGLINVPSRLLAINPQETKGVLTLLKTRFDRSRKKAAENLDFKPEDTRARRFGLRVRPRGRLCRSPELRNH
jgi:hypothetical protein